MFEGPISSNKKKKKKRKNYLTVLNFTSSNPLSYFLKII